MDVKRSNLKGTQPGVAPAPIGIFSIANQLRYGLALLIILSLLVTAGWLIYLAFQTQVQQLEVAQQERSRAAASEINAYVDDLQRKLAYLARIQGLADFTPQIQQKLLDGLSRHNDAYEIVAILSNTGQVITAVSSEQNSLAKDYANTPLFSRTYKQHEDYIGPVEQDPKTGVPQVILAVPIRNQKDEVGGVLLAQINLEYLWYVVSRTGVGDAGYAYVLDNRNFLIAEKGSNAETFKLQDISDQPFIQNLTSGNADPRISYQGLKGQDVLGAIASVRSLHWKVVVELPTAEAYAPIVQMVGFMGITLAIITIVAVGVGIYSSRQIVQPLQRLTEASTQIRAGNMDAQVKVSSRNEMGILATAFNQMTSQLKDLYTTLEQRIASRTQRLEVVAKLSERLAAILKLEELLQELVNQLKNEFGYYHAQVYLLDEGRQNLIMTAGVGEAGAQMKANNHHIPLNTPTSLVARAARDSEIVTIDNVREAPDWLPNALLPDTHSEMALPIILEGQVVGVLDVQSDKIGGLDEGDANLLRSLANQVAVGIRNAHQFAEVETALAEARTAQQRYLEQSWDKVKVLPRSGRYHYTRPNAPAWDRADALAKSVELQNTPIGMLQLSPNSPDQAWTEDDLAIVEAVSEELAQVAENLRLFDETRERANYERMIGEITQKIRQAPNLEALTKVASEALSQVLGVSGGTVSLYSQSTQTSSGRPSMPNGGQTHGR